MTTTTTDWSSWTAARRSSSSRRRRRRRQQLWQLKMWNSQGRQLALKFDLQWHTMRLSSSAIYGFYLWLHFYYTVQKEALMGSSHRRCTPPCPYSWQPPATTLLATVILTANFIDYSGLNCLLHVRIRRSIQRPLFMGPMSLHRGLFGIRALRAVSVYTRATIWDLAFRYGYDVSRSLFPFLYLWLSVHTGGKLSDWLQLSYSCCLPPIGMYFWNRNQWSFGDDKSGYIICEKWWQIYLDWRHQTGLLCLVTNNNSSSSSSSCEV